MTTTNWETPARAGEAEQVLLVMRGQRDRELLASWLDAEYEVATAAPDDDWGSFDACVVDAASYDEARASLVAHREAASPMFLPVLLLLPEDQRGADWVDREVGETVDQILPVPTRKRYLRTRLESLLRTRRLSVELADQREQLRVYRRAMDEAAVGVIITDPNRPDNPITYVNDRFEELTGYDEGEIRGRNCRFLQGPETDEQPVRRMREAIDAGEPVTVELVNYRKDGTPFWNRVTITPVYGEGSESDEVTCFLGFQEDVTERVERHRELRETAASFQDLYAVAAAGDLSFDEKLDELLELGADRLGVELGFFTRISEGTQHIVAARGDHELLQPGESCPLDRAYCRKTIETEGRLAVADAVAAGWEDDPAYETFGLGCYIGAKVTVDGDIYGTLCFADTDPRGESFSEAETALVDLMAQWVSYELERQARERELREQKERFERLVSQVEEYAIFMLDPDGHVVSWNEGAERIKGYTEEEILGEHFSVFYPDEAVEEGAPDRALARATTEDGFESEGWRVRKDGSRFWASAALTPIRDDEGNLEGFAKVTRDMTERRERERELERYETIVQTVNEAVWVRDEDKRCILHNRRAAEMLGVDPGGMVGRPLSAMTEFIDDEAFEDYERLVEDILAGEIDEASMDIDIRRPDGQVTLSVTLVPLESDGERTGIVGVGRDITDRVERERELERYETIVEAAADPIYAVDPEGRYTMVNDAMLEWLGQPREELVGAHASEVFDEAVVETSTDVIRDLLSSGERQEAYELPVTVDGERRLFEINVALLTQDDEFRGSIGVARDITDLRERERRLTVLDRVLRHNLRNKLNIVLARAQTIAQETDDAGLREHAEGIEHAGEQLLELGEQARRFQDSIDPGRGDVTTADVAELAAHVVDVARGDHPEADIGGDLPGEAWALAPGTLELALAELVENAVEHNDRERPTVRVSVTTEADEVVVRVADDGPGFDEMERRVLLRGAESPLEHMQGVGLWLVRWSVTGAGGDLDIEDNDPRGSVVTVRLPRSDPGAERKT